MESTPSQSLNSVFDEKPAIQGNAPVISAGKGESTFKAVPAARSPATSFRSAEPAGRFCPVSRRINHPLPTGDPEPPYAPNLVSAPLFPDGRQLRCSPPGRPKPANGSPRESRLPRSGGGFCCQAPSRWAGRFFPPQKALPDRRHNRSSPPERRIPLCDACQPPQCRWCPGPAGTGTKGRGLACLPVVKGHPVQQAVPVMAGRRVYGHVRRLVHQQVIRILIQNREGTFHRLVLFSLFRQAKLQHISLAQRSTLRQGTPFFSNPPVRCFCFTSTLEDRPKNRRTNSFTGRPSHSGGTV